MFRWLVKLLRLCDQQKMRNSIVYNSLRCRITLSNKSALHMFFFFKWHPKQIVQKSSKCISYTRYKVNGNWHWSLSDERVRYKWNMYAYDKIKWMYIYSICFCRKMFHPKNTFILEKKQITTFHRPKTKERKTENVKIGANDRWFFFLDLFIGMSKWT